MVGVIRSALLCLLMVWFELICATTLDKPALCSPQGLGGLQRLDLSLNGLSSIPLGLLDETQGLR